MKKSLKLCLSIVFSLLLFVSPLAVGFLCFGNNSQTLNEASSTFTPWEEKEQNETLTFVEPQVLSFEEYLTTLKLPTSINEIEGRGIETNPYRVKTQEEFVFLVTQEKWFVYVSIECDVTINEETFDKDGNVSGGDGIVYQFEPIINWHGGVIKGNENTINGLYYKDITQGFKLFPNTYVDVYDLNVENFFVEANTVTLISNGYLSNVGNCHTKNGYIICYNNSSGISGSAINATNCSNGATIIQKGNSAPSLGGVLNVIDSKAGKYENLVNYGDIIAESGTYVGGICSNSYSNGIVKNCKNYGDITITTSGVQRGIAGISGCCQGAIFIDCENYGEISKSSSTWACAGIYSYGATWSPIQMKNCRNFGKIVGGFGLVGSASDLHMNNCENYGTIINGCGFLGNISAGSMVNCTNYGDAILTVSQNWGVFASGVSKNLLVKNCKSYGDVIDNGRSKRKQIIGSKEKETTIHFENIFIDMAFDDTSEFYFAYYTLNCSFFIDRADIKLKGNSKICFTETCYDVHYAYFNDISLTIDARDAYFFIGNSIPSVEMTNCVVSGKNLSFTKVNLVKEKPKYIDGIVLNSTYKGETQRFYIGSNFSSFTNNFRTGKIGIRGLSGQSLYQGKVTEALLISRGYEKKVI